MARATFVGTMPMARNIKNMAPGAHGYTVPWAFDPRTDELDDRYTIHDRPGGTVQLRVDCVMPGVYRVSLSPSSTYQFDMDPAPAKF